MADFGFIPPYSFTRMLSYDSDAGWRVLFPVVLPDFHTADFPADGFGELINKFDDTRVFVGEPSLSSHGSATP